MGKLMWADGSVYEGNWQNDKQHGNGKIKWANGDFYEGEFLADQLHGRGKITYANGNSLDGTFLKGKIHGFGEYFNAETQKSVIENYINNAPLVKHQGTYETPVDDVKD